MELIRPLTNYRPAKDEGFRETFEARRMADPMTLTLYERDGKLILGTDRETYWGYRERQDSDASCVLIGHFTQVPGISVLERPFMSLIVCDENF